MNQLQKTNEHLDLRYDLDQQLTIVTYQEVITPQITAEAYQWMLNNLETGVVILEKVRGIIWDFRKVKRFEQGNFQAVRQESRRANEDMDLSHIPNALLVDNLYQEEMVRVASKITGQEKRIRILHSEDEVAAFFAEFHKKRTEEMPSPPQQS